MAQGVGVVAGQSDSRSWLRHDVADSPATRQERLLSMPTGGRLAARNGASSNRANALRAEDAAVHDWYRFVLSFPLHLVAEYLGQV